MLILFFAVLAFVSAAVLLISFLVRERHLSVNEPAVNNLDMRKFRSLFEPTADELKKVEREKEARARVEKESMAAQALADRAAAVRRRQSEWAAGPDRQNTVELLRVAAEHGKADVFASAALEIIEVFRKNGIDRLSASGLAELLDSHYRVLPAVERSSGELFLVKKKIAELAAEPIDKNA